MCCDSAKRSQNKSLCVRENLDCSGQETTDKTASKVEVHQAKRKQSEMELTPEEIRARRLRKLETGSSGGGGGRLAPTTAGSSDGQQQDSVMTDGDAAAVVASSAQAGKIESLI